MTPNHSHFEELCALAASAQLTSTELAELHEHSESCSLCTDRLVEMTQISAQLFCVQSLNQPGIRMPKGMLVRFIARAKSEGVPLTQRTATIDLSGSAVAAAFLLAVSLVFVSLNFRALTKSADVIGPDNVAIATKSLGVTREISRASVASNEPQARRTTARKRAIRNGKGIPYSTSRFSSDGPLSHDSSASIERSQFDLTAYSRSLAMFHRIFETAELNDNVQWNAAQYRMPRFRFAEPSEFIKDDPPRLLAEYEHQAFAPWSPQKILAPSPAEMQVLRRDFEPNAHGSLLSPDFKKNLPSFQFTPIARQ